NCQDRSPVESTVSVAAWSKTPQRTEYVGAFNAIRNPGATRSIAKIAGTVFALVLACGSLMAADATGSWKGAMTVTNPGGDPESHAAHLQLKQEGEKLSGTVGSHPDEKRTIENGKALEGNLTFEVPVGGGKMKFVLKQQGDDITGEVTREWPGM